MTAQSHTLQFPARDRKPGATRRRAASPDRPDATRQVRGAGGARILRRWSVAELIARAAVAPRAFA